MAAAGALAGVLFQWLNAAVTRFYAAHAAAPDVFLSAAHFLFACMAAIALLGGVAWILVQPSPDVTAGSVAIIVMASVGLGLHNLHLQIANARRLPLRYGMITARRAAVFLALAVAAISVGFGAGGVLATFAAACSVAVLFGARWRWTTAAYSADPRRRLVVYGMPMALAAASTEVLDVSDRFIIGWWHGSAVVAGYAAARDFTQQTVGVLLHVFLMAGFPRVMSAWESAGAPAAQRAMEPLARGLLLTAPWAVAAFVGMAPEISRFMFGVGVCDEAALVMPWIVLAVAVGCFKAYFLDIPLQLGQATGAGREIAFAWRFGRGPEADAYNLVLVLSLWLPLTVFSVMTVIVVPVLVRLRGDPPRDAARFVRELTGAALAAGLAIAAATWLLASWIVHVYSAGLPPKLASWCNGCCAASRRWRC